MAGMVLLGVASLGRAQRLPLAYVRTVVLAAPRIQVQSLHPHGGRTSVPPPEARSVAPLQALAREHFENTLQSRLTRIPGLTVIPAKNLASGGDEQDWLARLGADALIATSVEGFGVRGSTQREVWMLVSAKVLKADGTVLGPYRAYGWETRLRIPLFKSLITPDEKLAESAGDQAGRELAHALETGVEPLFANWRAAAIVPAAIPAVVAKELENGSSAAIAIPSVQRAADVLFQPAIPPFVPIVPHQRVTAALRRMGLQPGDLWTAEGEPDTAYAVRLGRRLGVDYLFISRVEDLALTEEAVSVPDGAAMRPGLERRADAVAKAALIRTSDGAVVWEDRLAGRTAARTEYVRHVPRIRTDEQCIGDAVRIAYAYLLFSLDDYRRSLVRERTAVVAK